MLGSLTTTQLSFFVIVVVAFGLLLTERLRGDLVALAIILAMAISGVLTPAEALAGFGSEPAIIVASILVLSAAVHRTGLDDSIGTWTARVAGTSYPRIVAVLMTTIALLSAFTHHVATTAVFLPVTLNVARTRHIAPSKLLMPVSFAASLGTTVLIIGAPAFLVASSVLEHGGRPGLSIASIAPIGLSLLLLGTLFMVLLGRWLLPARERAAEVGSRFRLDNYFTELTILPKTRWAGKTLVDVKATGRYQFTVVGWVRDGQRLPGPFTHRQLEPGDVLLVRTTPDDMVAFGHERDVELHPVEQFAASRAVPSSEEAADPFVQAVVAPQADLIGQTLRAIDFRRRFGPIVVGLWRQDGFVAEELGSIPLHAGDVLVLQGTSEQLARVERDRAFLLLVPFHGEARVQRKAPLAALPLPESVTMMGVFNTFTKRATNVLGYAQEGSHALPPPLRRDRAPPARPDPASGERRRYRLALTSCWRLPRPHSGRPLRRPQQLGRWLYCFTRHPLSVTGNGRLHRREAM